MFSKIINYKKEISGIFLAILVTNTVYRVDNGYVGLIFDSSRGLFLDPIVEEGIHYKIPFLQKKILFKTSEDVMEIPIFVQTASTSKVKIVFKVVYQPIKEKVRIIYIAYGPKYNQVIIPPFYYSILKSKSLEMKNSRELIEKQQILLDLINIQNEKIKKDYYVEVKSVSIQSIEVLD